MAAPSLTAPAVHRPTYRLRRLQLLDSKASERTRAGSAPTPRRWPAGRSNGVRHVQVSQTTKVLGAAGSIALAMTLSSCTGSDDADNTSPPATVTHTVTHTAEPPAATATSPETTSPATTSPPAEGSAQTKTALAAIATAEAAVQGGAVFDLEDDTDNGQRVWDVKVADPSGRQFELDISQDGSKVISKREDKTPDDDVAKLKQAKVTVQEAVKTAAGSAKGKGNLSALEIDTHRGTLVWQVGFGGDDGVIVLVDANSGKVIHVGTDD